MGGEGSGYDTSTGEPAGDYEGHSHDVTELGRLRAEAWTLGIELEAARRSIAKAAAAHQSDLGRLQSELEAQKAALVALQESVSWRLTRPLRSARRLLARRG